MVEIKSMLMSLDADSIANLTYAILLAVAKIIEIWSLYAIPIR